MNISPDNAAASQGLTSERLAAARSHGDDARGFDFAKAYLWMLIFSCLISLVTHASTVMRPPQILPVPQSIDLAQVDPKMLDLAMRVNTAQTNAFHASVATHKRAIDEAKRGFNSSLLVILIACSESSPSYYPRLFNRDCASRLPPHHNRHGLLPHPRPAQRHPPQEIS
jgi:hypothetical protein